MADVFTPLNPDRTKRLKFSRDEVKVLSGTIDRRGIGKHAEVEIQGIKYAVYGAACDLPNCQCDAVLKPLN